MSHDFLLLLILVLPLVYVVVRCLFLESFQNQLIFLCDFHKFFLAVIAVQAAASSDGGAR